MTIGVLAIQGDVIEHKRVLETIGVSAKEVRLPVDMEGVRGIILPGGESTAQVLLLKKFGLFDRLRDEIKDGLSVWGTCAGAILLAKEVVGKNSPDTLAVMDIRADRNAYGTHLDSFLAPLDMDLPGSSERIHLDAVFIRAPKLERMTDAVQVIASHEGLPVMLQQDLMLATSFHPELSDSTIIHEYFLNMCSGLLRH